MRNLIVAIVSLVALSGCGLEGMFGNAGRESFDRPASAIRGSVAYQDGQAARLSVLDPDGNDLEPFRRSLDGQAYEVGLPSARYSMIRVQGRAGDLLLRAIVPAIGEETTLAGVDLDARSTAEALIVETKLGLDGMTFRQINPEAYVGTSQLIREAFEQAGPTQDLLRMVERLMARASTTSGASDPAFFAVPEAETSAEGVPTMTASPLASGWLQRNLIDYDADGLRDDTSAPFDAKLLEAAQLYRPQGCPDPSRIRIVFTVDFTAGAKDGNGATVDRFRWAEDEPGKTMFFVGWVHEDSAIQDPAANVLLGSSTPNQVPMYDDGTNGDEVAGDGIWTVFFDLPRNLGADQSLRVGYKYTWGFRGQSWTGTEEWPGNSRIIEVVDANPLTGDEPDEIVYRRDVFGDEATNKDRTNLNRRGTGSLDWDTDLRGCGIPEAREQRFVEHDAATCGAEWHTPTSVGPITVACTE